MSTPRDIFAADPRGELQPPFTGGIPLTLSHFEKTRLLSMRVMQISNNARSTIPGASLNTLGADAEGLALEEIERGLVPLCIVRPKQTGGDQAILVVDAGGKTLTRAQ